MPPAFTPLIYLRSYACPLLMVNLHADLTGPPGRPDTWSSVIPCVSAGVSGMKLTSETTDSWFARWPGTRGLGFDRRALTSRPVRAPQDRQPPARDHQNLRSRAETGLTGVSLRIVQAVPAPPRCLHAIP